MSIKWNNIFAVSLFLIDLGMSPEVISTEPRGVEGLQMVVDILIADPCSSVPEAVNEISERKVHTSP
jgi:hypothetical protein